MCTSYGMSINDVNDSIGIDIIKKVRFQTLHWLKPNANQSTTFSI